MLAGSFSRAEVTVGYHHVNIKLYQLEWTNPPRAKTLELGIQDKYESEESGWQVSCIAQICTQSFSLLPCITELDILDDPFFSDLIDFEALMDVREWLELFHPFIAVRILRFSGELQSHVVSSLQELTMESVMEVLPALQSIYIRKYSGDEYHDEQQSIELFFAQCQHSGHSVSLQLT